MLNIADLSSNNSLTQQLQAIRENDGIIIKATEGKTYKNPYMKTDADTALGYGKLIGFYHFAKPLHNGAEDEALHFVNTVKDYLGNALLVLDWEGEALKGSQIWARYWLDTVYKITGVRPLLYVSEAYRKPVGTFVEPGNYGLWVAKYSKNAPQVDPWKFKALWQYTSSPYDKSHFYGDKKAWEAYGKRN